MGRGPVRLFLTTDNSWHACAWTVRHLIKHRDHGLEWRCGHAWSVSKTDENDIHDVTPLPLKGNRKD